jgi:hypothetical protein
MGKNIGADSHRMHYSLSGAAFADEFHYTNLLIGDRAPGMGGAYTAVSDDATGLTIIQRVRLRPVNLSASVNAYYYDKHTGTSSAATDGNTRSSLLPNYFGVVNLGGWIFDFPMLSRSPSCQTSNRHSMTCSSALRSSPSIPE